MDNTAIEQEVLARLRDIASDLSERAHAPFTGTREAAVLLLSDGAWIPGVRVESASFSVTIPPLVNAFTTARALNRSDIVAGVQSRPLRTEEQGYVAELRKDLFFSAGEDAFKRQGDVALPDPTSFFPPALDEPAPRDPTDGVRLAAQVAARAHVPASHFRVGCVGELEDGTLVPGVNVEHPNWSLILCAERNVLGTLASYDLPPLETLYLSCPSDPRGSPCGACRQLLVELVPEQRLWMDRGSDAPELTRPKDLLPGFFNGQALLHTVE